MMLIFFSAFIILWFAYLSTLTFYRFSRIGIKFSNPLNYIMFPVILFLFHVRLAASVHFSFRQKLVIMKFFVMHYKRSLIFFGEMILEHAAQYSVTGYSPTISSATKEEKNKSIFAQIIEWLNKPTSNAVFERLVFA